VEAPLHDALDGRVALVTGGGRSIGRAICLALARAGAHVAVNHRAGGDEARQVVREIQALGGTAIAVCADVANPGEIEDMATSVRKELGPIGILVNNAGIARALPLDAIRLATWDATMAVNMRAPFLLCSAVLPEMRKVRWGRLLFVSSTAARVGGIVGPHYAASKAGLEGLMRSYASLMSKEGITSNAIAPALIETDMLAGNPAATPNVIPVGRFGTSDEVADLLVSVARNPYVTGQTIQVNGGIYMT